MILHRFLPTARRVASAGLILAFALIPPSASAQNVEPAAPTADGVSLKGVIVSVTISDGSVASTTIGEIRQGRQTIGGIHGRVSITGTAIDATIADGAVNLERGGRACQIIGGITGPDLCSEAKPR